MFVGLIALFKGIRYWSASFESGELILKGFGVISNTESNSTFGKAELICLNGPSFTKDITLFYHFL